MIAHKLPEYRQFIKAITESPDDDLSRMIFCDFIDENAGTCERCNGTGRVFSSQVSDIKVSPSGVKVNQFKANCYLCDGTGSDDSGMLSKYIRKCISEKTPKLKAKQNIRGCHVGVTWDRGLITDITCSLQEYFTIAGECAYYQPITKWEIADCYPSLMEDEDDESFQWNYNLNQTIDAEKNVELKRRLFDLIPAPSDGNTKYFISRKSAKDAFYTATCKLARQLADDFIP